MGLGIFRLWRGNRPSGGQRERRQQSSRREDRQQDEDTFETPGCIVQIGNQGHRGGGGQPLGRILGIPF